MAEDLKSEHLTKEDDNHFEKFMLEQVISYGNMHRWASKVYTICIIACIVMCVAGLAMGKSIGGALFIGLWSLGFFTARMASLEAANSVAASAEEIERAIEDPNFNIPDDYPEDILALRSTVCPTIKNTTGQVIAYGIIALSCWAGGLIIAFVSLEGTPEWGLFMTSLILGAMGFGLTILMIRALKCIPAAREYEKYLNRKARE